MLVLLTVLVFAGVAALSATRFSTGRSRRPDGEALSVADNSDGNQTLALPGPSRISPDKNPFPKVRFEAFTRARCKHITQLVRPVILIPFS